MLLATILLSFIQLTHAAVIDLGTAGSTSSVVEIPIDAILPYEIVAKPTSIGEASAGASVLFPEQAPEMPVVLHHALHARMTFRCPVGGSHVRDLSWESVFSFETYKIKIRGIHLVDRVDPINVNIAEFDTYLHHSFCLVVSRKPLTFCSYHMRWQTFGEVNHDSIDMDITTDSAYAAENPTVTEACLVIKPGMYNHMCSTESGPFTASLCKVKKVETWDM